MKKTLLICALFGALPAFAQDWALKDTDRALSADEMTQRIVGKSLTFYDNGVAKFSAGGAYSYTYHEGGSAFGSFRLEEDGVVCVAFQNGWTRCDKYVDDGSKLVMVTQKGERFPLRPQAED